MSVFIKLNREEIESMMKNVSSMKNSLINLNDYVIEKKNQLKEKQQILSNANNFINDAHENLQNIISMMPHVESIPFKNQLLIKRNSSKISSSKEEPHTKLEKLKGKISQLR